MNAPHTNLKKNKKLVAALAFLGALQPTPIPLAGIHKLYLGHYGWGIIYLFLGTTQVPRIACVAEGVWYLLGGQLPKEWSRLGAILSRSISPATTGSNVIREETVAAVANSLREIERLRQEGPLSEHEFEQKRRSLLEQMP